MLLLLPLPRLAAAILSSGLLLLLLLLAVICIASNVANSERQH
jgi:hypothetical protein